MSRLIAVFIMGTAFLLNACDNGRDQEAPTGVQIIQGYSPAPDMVVLGWLPARDNSTKTPELAYEIHLSESKDFTPSDVTLIETVTGKEDIILKGLKAETVYFPRIIAVDKAGNRGPEAVGQDIPTLKDAPIVNEDTVLQSAEDLNLGEPQIAGDLYTFTIGPNTQAPTPGAVITGPVGDEGYLRKVTSVSESNGSLLVQTSEANLSELYSQAQIKGSTPLYDIPAATENLPAERWSRETLDDGSVRTVLYYASGKLMAEQFDYAPAPETTELNQVTALFSTPLSITNAAAAAAPSVEDNVDAAINVDFNPDFNQEIVFGPFFLGIEQARISITGEFKATGHIKYKASALGPIKEREKLLFRKTYFPHRVIPHKGVALLLYTKVILTVHIKTEAQAYAELEATANLLIEADMEYGVLYNPTTDEWESIAKHPDPDISLTSYASLRGGIKANVKVIPQIEVEYMKVLSYKNSYQAAVHTELEVEAIIDQDILNDITADFYQFSKYDFFFRQRCVHSASLKFFTKNIKELLEETAYCEPDDIPLFDLPEQKVAVEKGDSKFDLLLEVEDGTHNAFNNDSVRWHVYPADAGTLSQNPTNPRRAVFTPTSPNTMEDNYFFYASGHGILGDIGRRWVKAENKDVCMGDIFLAGKTGGQPAVWINGTEYRLSVIDPDRGGQATDVFVSGPDVYVSGYSSVKNAAGKSITLPAFWKNGERTDLPVNNLNNNAKALAIAVSGSDVYVAGWTAVPAGNNRIATAPSLWKNGVRTDLSVPNAAYSSQANDVTVSGTDVYISGTVGIGDTSASYNAGMPAYWKNGSLNMLPVIDSGWGGIARSITVSGTDVYVSGESVTLLAGEGWYNDVPAYWKNGIRTDLSKVSSRWWGGGFSIAVSDSDVYVAGATGNEAWGQIPAFWKSGARTDLVDSGSDQTGYGFSIALCNSDVYVVGTTETSNYGGKYAVWKNGVIEPFNAGQIFSIFMR